MNQTDIVAVNGFDRSRVPEAGDLRPFSFPPIHEGRLSNGIRVLIATVPRLPVVTTSIAVAAGGVHEPRERGGLATLTASLLESGAGGRSAEEVADVLESLGVHAEISAGWDRTHVGFTALASRLAPAIEIFSDLVRSPEFPLAEVERLRGEQLAGLLQRRVEPRGLANEMISKYVFAESSPFSRPLDGSRESVTSITRSDVVSFHQDRYRPAGATILFAGHVSVDDGMRLAEEQFGSWAGAAPDPVAVSAEPRSADAQLVSVDRPGAVQSEVRVGHVGVARDTPDYFAILVMNAILGGAFTSRLNLNLRERHGFTYGVSSGYSMRRQPGPFVISTAVQTEVTAPALSEILKEVEGIRDEQPLAREMEDARNYLAGVFPLTLQTTAGVAARLAELAVHDLDLDYFDQYAERILETTADQVYAAAERYLRPDQLTAVVVGDAEKIADELQALGFSEPTIVKAKDE